MENVKGLLSAKNGGEKMIGRILADLKMPGEAIGSRNRDLGYRLYSFTTSADENDPDPNDFLVKAEEYGIPQARHRLLILDGFDIVQPGDRKELLAWLDRLTSAGILETCLVLGTLREPPKLPDRVGSVWLGMKSE